MPKIIQTEVSEMLWYQAHQLIEQGWVSDMQSLFHESLRRYIESHNDMLNESFIQEDIEWGLHGDS